MQQVRRASEGFSKGVIEENARGVGSAAYYIPPVKPFLRAVQRSRNFGALVCRSYSCSLQPNCIGTDIGRTPQSAPQLQLRSRMREVQSRGSLRGRYDDRAGFEIP